MFKSHEFQKSLLKWYDRHRRALPWRAAVGRKSDPYHVWLSEIMLQQTTVGAVIPYFEKFLKRWPDLKKFAKARQDEVLKEWAGLGYYARARNLHKCAQLLVKEHGAVFPATEKELQALPGIGAYTSAAIAAIAFDDHAVVIDGNVERVTARLFAIETPLKESKPGIRDKAALIYKGVKRPGDFAQSLMDLGATVCIPKTPRCGVCPVSAFCKAYARGIQGDLPAKAVKSLRPNRTGRVYWLENAAGEVLLERRDEGRMLGGMLGLPTTDWDGKPSRMISKDQENALKYEGDVYHSFTHFDLKLELWRGRIRGRKPAGGSFYKSSEIAGAGLPSVFQKVTKMVLKNARSI